MTRVPEVTHSIFGKTARGEEATLYTLRNRHGLEVSITNFGGIITSLKSADKEGRFIDIVHGFEDLEPYLGPGPYFGALIGRFGNRIANACFSLDGQVFQLDKNDGPNHLHGGFAGFDKVLWQAKPITAESTVGLELFHLSPDGDQGYPGNLQLKVRYTLTDDNELVVDYFAVTDRATPINLTQHSYFNLAGAGDVLDHQMLINADGYTPTDDKLIPLGEVRPVAGTPFDFRAPKTIGQDIRSNHEQIVLGRGYDHNFVLNRNKGEPLSFAARVTEPTTGRVLEVWTEEPGVQFYSGNFLDGSLSGKGRIYSHRSGFCLETQHFPDSPNQTAFPSTILRPGEEYKSKTVFKFLTVNDLG